ncbi:protein FAM98A [Magallana gigas]|uniref:protein FAM98A n=1 Tax=Magallana gigas TaxID=29159 RepID=UPI00333F231E
MENDILDSLEDLGYDGSLLDPAALSEAVSQGPASTEFTKLVSWLTDRLKDFCGLEETIHATHSPDDAANFVMELSGCLRELNCPYTSLYEGGPVTERLKTKESAVQLLDYLTSELQTAHILAVKKPQELRSTTSPDNQSIANESDIAKHLKIMLIALGFPKPPANINSFQLFSRVETKVNELMSKNPGVMSKPLLKARLSDKQWEQIMKINDSLVREYTTRREMILKRLDVTIQSFMWSEAAKKRENEIAAVYQPVRKLLKASCDLSVADILSAREDLTYVHKTSSGDARVRCAINKVKIPKVPDRGGRVWEQEPPPPEMPSFQKRVDQPQGQRPQSGRGGRGGRGGRSDRGGKVQGGWGDQQQGQSYGGNWNQSGGGYGGGGGRGRDHYQQDGGHQGGGYQGGYNDGGHRGGGRGRGGRPGSGRGRGRGNY